MSRHTSPRLLVLAAAFILSLTACVPARLGVSWASVSTVGEEKNILIAYNNYLSLVNPTTGKEVQLLNSQGQIRRDDNGNPLTWYVDGQPQGAQFFSAPVSVEDGALLAVDYNKRIFRVDFATARIENPTGVALTGQVIADMAVAGDKLYVPMFEGGMIAHDLNNPEEIVWSYSDVNPNEEDRITNGIWSKPLVTEDTLYFSSMDHGLYAVDIETGELRWKTDLGGALAATPVLHNGSLYIGSFGRKLFEVNARSGEVTHEFETQDWVWSSPAIVDDTLYMTDLGGYVYALTAGDGLQTVWSGKKTRIGIRPAPLVTEKYVIVVSRDGQAVWLERETGNIVHENEIGAEVLSDILLVEPGESLDIPDSLVVFSSVAGDRTLVAFTLDNAARQWTYAR